MRKYTVHKGQQAAKPIILLNPFSYKFFWNKLQKSKVVAFDHTWGYVFPQDQYSDCQMDWLKLWGYDVKTIYPANDWTIMLAGRYNHKVNKIEVTAYFNNDGQNIHPSSTWAKEHDIEFPILQLDVPEGESKTEIITSIYVDRNKKLGRVSYGAQKDNNGNLLHEYEVIFNYSKKPGRIAREINFYHGGNCKAIQDINLYK